jgi:hypothetical protein
MLTAVVAESDLEAVSVDLVVGRPDRGRPSLLDVEEVGEVGIDG